MAMVQPEGTAAPNLREIQFVDASCRRCGQPISVVPPHGLTVLAPPESRKATSLRGRFYLLPGYGDPSLCLLCRLAALPPQEAAPLDDEYRCIADSAADAGIPDGAPIWPLHFTADDDNAPPAWRGFRGRHLAIQVARLPPNLKDWAELNSIRFIRADSELSIDMLIYETLIWHERIAASLVFQSNPAHGSTALEVRNWQVVKRASDLPHLMKGAELYLALRQDGRPRGGTNWTEADFRDELPRARAKLKRRHGRMPLDGELAADMGISSSTFGRYKREWITKRSN
jgi:hypothetical protein